ncbi:MAG TPA: tyrosine-type recombinase/integrase [Terricaulis sp.]|nr:tyrosine-type recombinase/integrase [Terricaulis sp.]
MDGIRARITLRLIDATAAPKEGELRIWDTDVRGFALRITPTGRKSYCLKYRYQGRQRWLTIGEHGSPWTPDTARSKAKEALYQASHGEDPQAAKIETRLKSGTVKELFERYLVEGRIDKPLKRESSWKVDQYNYRRHIEPLLGKRIARELTLSDLSQFQARVAQGKTSVTVRTKAGKQHAVVKGGTGAAARAMRALSTMMAWAVRHGILDQNLCGKIQKYRDQMRERALTEEEASGLWTMIAEAQAASVITKDFADIFRLIMLTGARRNEIVALRWSEVDFDRARIVLPPVRTKMGALNRSRTIALSQPALEILQGVKERGEHVFPSSVGDQPLVGVNRAWDKVRVLAGIPDVRLHDLRHSFATFAVEGGASLYHVGRALGHTKTSTTERYAHPSDAGARAVASEVATRFVGTRSAPPAPRPATLAPDGDQLSLPLFSPEGARSNV